MSLSVCMVSYLSSEVTLDRYFEFRYGHRHKSPQNQPQAFRFFSLAVTISTKNQRLELR